MLKLLANRTSLLNGARFFGLGLACVPKTIKRFESEFLFSCTDECFTASNHQTGMSWTMKSQFMIQVPRFEFLLVDGPDVGEQQASPCLTASHENHVKIMKEKRVHDGTHHKHKGYKVQPFAVRLYCAGADLSQLWVCRFVLGFVWSWSAQQARGSGMKT